MQMTVPDESSFAGMVSAELDGVCVTHNIM